MCSSVCGTAMPVGMELLVDFPRIGDYSEAVIVFNCAEELRTYQNELSKPNIKITHLFF